LLDDDFLVEFFFRAFAPLAVVHQGLAGGPKRARKILILRS
jgi:hypothetical protein